MIINETRYENQVGHNIAVLPPQPTNHAPGYKTMLMLDDVSSEREDDLCIQSVGSLKL